MDNKSACIHSPAQRRALLTGGVAHFIHDGFTDMLYIFFPIWQMQFALSFTEIGILKTLFSGTMAGFQVPSGAVSTNRNIRLDDKKGTLRKA
ncbi:hypothetical protein AXX12_17370 [Anaerosporomusa subterranea]|uniref:Major facilitator superfamily (MFS) profile domain-containing protein n=2 Tax=Anaerosporomusa subterranea TaxID=1794912 RepID=A0A154BV74_ANASB|nr:hypothetical protein AXX12_17370 [Anaerosporomusa subterranea]